VAWGCAAGGRAQGGRGGAGGRRAVAAARAERDIGSTPAGPLRDVLSSAASLVLQLQACGLSHLRRRVSAATRCSPRSTSSRPPPRPTANKLRFQQVLGVTLQLQDILCGVSLAELKPELAA